MSYNLAVMDQRRALSKINQRGALLVFPIKNAKEPASLWSELHPRTIMRWEWNENGDDKVGDLWHLMKRLSSSRKVVYSKWFQGRATFFSRPVFTALLALSLNRGSLHFGLSRQARDLLDILESDSPLSTKQLKKMADLQGRDNESTFQRAMKQLFNRFLIVAYGEVDDGAFPSLAVGSTRLLFEDLWNQAHEMRPAEAQKIADKNLPVGSKLRKYFDKNLNDLKVNDLRDHSHRSTEN